MSRYVVGLIIIIKKKQLHAIYVFCRKCNDFKIRMLDFQPKQLFYGSVPSKPPYSATILFIM